MCIRVLFGLTFAASRILDGCWHARFAQGLDDDDWKQLSVLYKQLEEHDIVRGLYDKFSRHPSTKDALVHELEGRYYKARETYKVLMVKLNDVEDDPNGTWDPEPEPSELEKDLWEVKFIS